jgi:short-subunit dehydrogenase
MEGTTVMITGASSGIGEALARAAATRRANVVLLARRQARLEALADELSTTTRALAIRCDVTQPEQIRHAVGAAVERFGGLNMVLANAGMGVGGNLLDLSVEDYRRQFDVNVFGVLNTLYATLGELERRSGMVGVMGSVNGYLNIPGHSAYCMSKAAVRSLCACLRHELLPRGVSITHLAPGFVKSEFRHSDSNGVLIPEAEDPIPAWLAADALPVAHSILDAVCDRKEEAVFTLHGRAVIELAKHTPQLVSGLMGKSGPLIRRWSRRG